VAGQDFTGCSFAERCSFVQDSCRAETPPLLQIGARHLAACPVLNPVAVEAVRAHSAEVA
jgi:ABC-type dipeptide/oligopeptide/nickel transport system ATPase component